VIHCTKSHNEIAKTNPFETTDLMFLFLSQNIRMYPFKIIPKRNTKRSQKPKIDSRAHDDFA
jgi:hypothetical protein